MKHEKEWKAAVSANLATTLITEIDRYASERRLSRSEAISRLLKLGIGTARELELSRRETLVSESRKEAREVLNAKVKT